MIKIPKKFQLFGRTFKVTLPWKINKEDWYGECDYEKASIKIKRGLSTEDKEVTYLHEITHAIFDALGYDKLRDDEVLVDRFSKALHQVLNSGE